MLMALRKRQCPPNAELGFESVYVLIEILAPGSFATSGGAAAARENLVYFSFVTLTTLGYGDLTPVAVAARHLLLGKPLVRTTSAFALASSSCPSPVISARLTYEVTSRAARRAPDR